MSNDITKIDQNLKVETSFTESDLAFFDVRKEPFRVYGLYNYKNEPEFKRIPEAIAESTSENVKSLNFQTAGGRVRFKTTSRYVAIKTIMRSIDMIPHMTLAGRAGFDLYVNHNGKSIYYRTFLPPVNMKSGYESILYFPDNTERDLTINFPLYNDVCDLYIGLQESAGLTPGNPYRFQNPVLYYGSSITQGGCASRPGNSYEAIISRMLDCDYINMGFSGSALGEESIVNYMADLQMSVFVCDYDHNAPNATHLANTHEKLYQKVREKNSTLPIILISKPDFDSDRSCNIQRRNVIYQTYLNAINAGDKNVYFIDGESLFGNEGRDSCTVDGCHPNDLGFMRMAEKIGYVIKQVIQ